MAVYRSHRVTPEYVLLVDRLGRGDHQARLAESLYQQLRVHQVPVTRYFLQTVIPGCSTPAAALAR